jgi:hypothetical protein
LLAGLVVLGNERKKLFFFFFFFFFFVSPNPIWLSSSSSVFIISFSFDHLVRLFLASLFWGTFFFLILFFSIFFFFFSYRSSSTSYFRKKKASRNRVPPPPPPSSLPTVSSCRRPYLIWPALGYLSLCVYTLSKNSTLSTFRYFLLLQNNSEPSRSICHTADNPQNISPKILGTFFAVNGRYLAILFFFLFIPYRTSMCVSSILFFFFFFSCSSYT